MRRMASPSSSRCLNVSMSASITAGASPSDGSSMRRIVGFVTSARPIASICCSRRRAARRRSICAARGAGRARTHDRASIRSPPRRAPGGDAQVLVDGQRGEQPATLRDVADASPRDLVRDEADQLVALEADRASARGGEMPMIALQSVVLPIPFRPTIATDSRPIVNATSSSACALP